jgi:tyrosine-protein kinase Etk/Wzc
MNSTPVFSEHADDDEPSLSDWLDTILQYFWLIVGTFLVVLVIGIVYALVATPIYRSDVLIQVEDKKPSGLAGVQQLSDALGTAASPVTGEIEIMRSRGVILKALEATNSNVRIRVANRMPLIGNWYARHYANGTDPVRAPFFGLSSFSWGGEQLVVDALSVPGDFYDTPLTLRSTGGKGYTLEDEDGDRLGSGVVGQALNFTLGGHAASLSVSRMQALPGNAFEIESVSPVAAYRDVLLNMVVAESGRASNIVRLSYESPNEAFSRALVNAIGNAYISQNVERHSAEAAHSLTFLNQQLPEIKHNVELAEDALNAFRTRTNTVNVDKSTEALLAQAVDVEKGKLQLQLQRDQLAQLYRRDHPVLKAMDAQLAEANRARVKVDSIIDRLPAAERDLLRLQRDSDVSTQLYTTMLTTIQQLQVTKAGTIGDVRILDYAIADPKPVSPKRIPIVLGAAMVGLLLGIAAAMMARKLRPTVRDSDQLERGTGLVSYANIPESVAQEKLNQRRRQRSEQQAGKLLAILHPEDPAIESLRALRTGLAFALIGAKNKNIVITGATAGVGKSFVSANLSALLASSSKRVLLIETDFRRPQLANYFGFDRDGPGLSNLLLGTSTFDQVVRTQPVGDSELHIISSGMLPPNPSEMLLTSGFSDLLEAIQSRYDHIILDSAPILPVSDTLAVVRNSAITFLIVRSEHSTLDEVKGAVKRITAAGGVVKGLVFNGVMRRRVSYNSAYRYHYVYGKK